MADATAPAWLPSLCGGPERSPVVAQPHALEHDGRRYVVATNGHACVIIASGSDHPPLPDSVAAAAHRWMSAPTDRVTSLAALRRWAGRQTHTAPCPVCRGAQDYRCPTCGARGTCLDCGGKGTVQVREYRPGTILGLRIDRRLLADYLQHVVGETVLVGVVQQDGPPSERPLVVAGEDWRVIVMPLRWEGPGEATDAEEYRFEEADCETYSAAMAEHAPRNGDVL